MPMTAEELRPVGVGHVDRDGVAARDGHRPGDAGGGEVLLGRVAGRDGVHRDVLAFDGGCRLHLLAAGPGCLGGDVVRTLLGVDLAAEVDGQPDKDHHDEARQRQPDADRAAFVATVGASSALPPGVEWGAAGGLDDAASGDSRHGQVGQVEAGTRPLPRPSRSRRRACRSRRHRRPRSRSGNGCPGWPGSLARQSWRPASPRAGVRAIEAVRAASAAADSTAEWVVAVRPPKMMSPTKSTKAGRPTTASIAADPRSSLSAPTSSRCGQPLHGQRRGLDDHGVPAGDHAQAVPRDGHRDRGGACGRRSRSHPSARRRRRRRR